MDPEGSSSDSQLEQGDSFALIGVAATLKYQWNSSSVDQLMADYKDMVSSKQHMTKETGMFMLRPINVSPHKNHEFDAYLIQGGIGSFEGGYIYDFKTDRFIFLSWRSFWQNLPSLINFEIAGLQFVSKDSKY